MCRKRGRNVRSTSFPGLLLCRPKGVSVCSVVRNSPPPFPPRKTRKPASPDTESEVWKDVTRIPQPRFHHSATSATILSWHDSIMVRRNDHAGVRPSRPSAREVPAPPSARGAVGRSVRTSRDLGGTGTACIIPLYPYKSFLK